MERRKLNAWDESVQGKGKLDLNLICATEPVCLFVSFLVQAINPIKADVGAPEDSGIQGRPGETKPNKVGTGGEFTYAVPFDLPKFRGLKPSIGLTYNSSNTSRGGTDNIVAFGWRMAGRSRIERISVGGGVPLFDDGQDLYRLDGEELMSCSPKIGH